MTSSIGTLATVVDWEALLDTTLASIVAGIGVTIAIATAIYGFATFAEMRRENRALAAAGGAAAAILGLLVFSAAIAAGLFVMIRG